MRTRCNNPNYFKYHLYGGRGITICNRWNDFSLFVKDMGYKPHPSYSIDRIDTNGPYNPENCRWASKTTQSRNKRTIRLITYRDKTQCIAAWAEEFGIPRSTISWRLQNGKSDLEAIGVE